MDGDSGQDRGKTELWLDAGAGNALVGARHPHIVDALERQLHHPAPAERLRQECIDRLLKLFPPTFSVAYLLHSTSEACELALRLARAHRPGKDAIVLEDADYGMTTSLANMSPARFRAKGGGQKFWVQVARRGDAASVIEKVEGITRSGRGVCGFFPEGVFDLDSENDGFLRQSYESVRNGGGLNVAIECQTGLGRVGPAMWEFARHGLVEDPAPDIVVVGESLGNGLPIAAVVTRAELAAPFPIHEGAHPLCCAAALAVMDVLEDPEGPLVRGLVDPELKSFGRGARGSGLCWEIDVDDARAALTKLHAGGVTMGSRGNTLLFRPPLTFSQQEAAQFQEILRDCV